MLPPRFPANETARLEALRQYELLDTVPEPELDDLTRLASHLCGMPISLISLIDGGRQWFKSRHGLDVSETPRDVSFCGHTILGEEPFVVPDAARDERFADNTLVTGPLGIRFYAGVPLINADGFALGTLCVMDRRPHELGPVQRTALVALGRQVMVQMELRRQARELRASEQRFRALIENSSDAIVLFGADGVIGLASDSTERILGFRPDEMEGRNALDFVRSDCMDEVRDRIATVMRHPRVPIAAQAYVQHKDGRHRYLHGVMTNLLGDPAVRAVVVNFRDITERRNAEERIRHLNRTYAVLSNINQLIVRGCERQSVLDAACRISVEKGGFRLAWIALAEPGLLQPRRAACAGVVEDCGRLALSDLGQGSLGGGPVAQALVTREICVCNDIESDVRFAGWREQALARGCRASVAFPLAVRGRSVGAYSLYSHEPGFFDEAELALLGELASDIAFALEGCERERERQEAAARLVEAERRYRDIFENAIEGIFQSTPEGRYLTVNPAFARILGYASAADLLAHCEDIARQVYVDPRDRQRFKQRLEAHGEVVGMEHEAFRKDGTRVWVSLNARLIRDPADGSLRYEGSIEDVTERKAAERALREGERRFRELIENASDLVTVVDTHGVIRFQGPSSERVLGYRPDQMEGRSAFEWMHAEDVASVGAAIQRAVANPRMPTTAEFRMRHQDGSWRVLESVGRSIAGPEDDEGRIVVNSRDVTESRRLAEQLRQSQRLDAIGQLAGGVAHDFNNILAAMMMQIDLCATAGTLSAEVKEGLDEVRASAERAANLTRQLLLFGRKQVMRSRTLDLNEVVANLVRMLQRIIGEHIQLQLHLYSAPLRTHADAGMLDQVLVNLAVNARDAMAGGGRLLIETARRVMDEAAAREHPDAVPGDYVWLCVSDTGTGIAPEILPRIFEPFFTTKEPGKGTGLGLATVFGIVKQHRGWIKVESCPGVGTSFQVFLPADRSDAPVPAEPLVPRIRGGTETLLLVEDDARVRLLTRITLERQGYHVVEAASGAEAIELWSQQRDRIRLLITDLVMPGSTNGHQLARRLQADAPRLRTLFISGHSAEIAGRELELRAGDIFLQKPYAPDALLGAVRRCLDT